jgi:hypothetical protein
MQQSLYSGPPELNKSKVNPHQKLLLMRAALKYFDLLLISWSMSCIMMPFRQQHD